MENLSYKRRLARLNLYSVKGRLMRADVIKYWKILHDQSVIHLEDILVNANVGTRGHSHKLAH